jgi:hypothetical protein
LQKILTSLRVGPNATQARPTEKSNYTTIFSRTEKSESKFFLSLKNFFSRADKSSASSAVAKVIPQATTESIKTENTKSVIFEPDQRTRLRMAYRDLLGTGDNGVDYSGKKRSYEEKVSMFDSAVAKLQRGDELKDWDEKTLDEVLPKLKTAVEENEKLGEAEKKQLLSDVKEIQKRMAEQTFYSVLKSAYQGD